MRSIGLASLASLGLLAVLAAPVAAAPPTKEPSPIDPVEFLQARSVTSPSGSRTPATRRRSRSPDGTASSSRTSAAGSSRPSPTWTRASVTRNSSGPGKLSVNAAGHLVIRFGGASVLPFFDGDVTGRGLLYLKGGGAEFEIGDDGFFYIRAEFPKHVEGSLRDPRLTGGSRMPELTYRATLDHPPDAVFAFVADAENNPTWHEHVRETRWLDDGPTRLGRRGRQTGYLFGRDLALRRRGRRSGTRRASSRSR